MTERFKKAYDALYNAWENGTLAKGLCAACAVGNIVAAGQGFKVTHEVMQSPYKNPNSYWMSLFYTSCGEQNIRDEEMSINKESLDALADRLFKETGYTEKELAAVEYAFEKNTEIVYELYSYHSKEEIEKDQYNGLMAVMDVLIELDSVKEGKEFKDTFNKKLEKYGLPAS